MHPEGTMQHTIFLIDTAGLLISWNPGVGRVLGYSREEWIGQSAEIIFTAEDRAAGLPEREMARARTQGHSEDIRWHVRKDGTRFFADGFLTTLYGGDTGDLIGYSKVLRDATEQRKMALRESEEYFRLAAEATEAGIFDFNPTRGELNGNSRCRALLGLPPDVPVNYALFLSGIHPTDRGRIDASVRRALDPESGTGGEFEAEFRTVSQVDGVERWVLAKGRVFFDAEGAGTERFVGTVIDVSQRRQAEDALRESAEFQRRLIESSPDCIKTLDLDGRVLTMNEGGQQLFGVRDFDAICGADYLTFWQSEETRVAVSSALEAARAGGRGRFEGACPTMTGEPRWWDVVIVPILGADGAPERLLGVSRDITAQHNTWERERFLARLSERTGALLDPDAVLEETLREVGAFLRLSRFLYADVDIDTGMVTARREVSEGRGMETEGRSWPLSAIDALAPELQAGRTLINCNTAADPRTRDRYETVYEPANARAVVSVPLLREGRWVGYFSAISPAPRDWTEEEVSLLQAVAERMWISMENARLFRETRTLAEREALINQIGDGIRRSLPAEEIEGIAVAALGKALSADRCYVFTIDAARDVLVVAQDWHIDSVPALAGQYRLSSLGIDVNAVFGSGESLVVSHLQGNEDRLSDQNAAANQGFRVSSLINVPFYEDGRFVGALAVAMAHGARQWTTEEVALAEMVAAQLRSAVEAARLQQRERTISQHLQEALVPQPPTDIPGLALASFYRPALDEASVGGDAFDVFPLQEGRLSALCVFDLAGKGLAAASQVATVRNMLRFALYSHASLSEAVTQLNRILVRHNLLTGFATLFIGVFCDAKRTLTYVNGGQEPGLLWRAASGQIEELEATGSVLGGFDEGAYQERTVPLEPGDMLALFTDGMTEVGPHRKAHLGVDGLAPCLRTAARRQPKPPGSLRCAPPPSGTR